MNTLLPNSLPAEKSCLKGQITQTAKQILSYLLCLAPQIVLVLFGYLSPTFLFLCPAHTSMTKSRWEIDLF